MWVDPYGLEVIGKWVNKPFPEVYDVQIPAGYATRSSGWWKVWENGGAYRSMDHRVDVHAGFQWAVKCTDTTECSSESWQIDGGYADWFSVDVPIHTPAIPKIGFYISLLNITNNLLINPATSRGMETAAMWADVFYESNSATSICLVYPKPD
jgi:hypothetical protein